MCGLEGIGNVLHGFCWVGFPTCSISQSMLIKGKKIRIHKETKRRSFLKSAPAGGQLLLTWSD